MESGWVGWFGEGWIDTARIGVQQGLGEFVV